MIIASSNVTASSVNAYFKSETSSLSLRAGSGGEEASVYTRQDSFVFGSYSASTLTYYDNKGADGHANQQKESGDKQNQTAGENLGMAVKSSRIGSARNIEGKDPLQLKLEIVQRMISMLTGRPISVQQTDFFASRQQSMMSLQTLESGGGLGSGAETLEMVRSTETFESQSFTYSAAGVVKTADGKTIGIDINLSMSSATAQYIESKTGISIQRENRKVDPLVINYGGTAASLTEQKFDFDLDADGALDSISFAGQGSGFLAFDKNGDGKIGDGSELFGPQSGNGFDDLRQYDSDGNGWIDEADEIYSKLKIWSKDENGNDLLFTLKEADVGAIYLGEVETRYAISGSTGALQGEMRYTSFFLKDSGGAGTVSHIDLLV